MLKPLTLAAALAAVAAPSLADLHQEARILTAASERPIWTLVVENQNGALSVPHLMRESACSHGIQQLKDTSRTPLNAFCMNTHTGDVLWPWSITGPL